MLILKRTGLEFYIKKVMLFAVPPLRWPAAGIVMWSINTVKFVEVMILGINR